MSAAGQLSVVSYQLLVVSQKKCHSEPVRFPGVRIPRMFRAPQKLPPYECDRINAKIPVPFVGRGFPDAPPVKLSKWRNAGGIRTSPFYIFISPIRSVRCVAPARNGSRALREDFGCCVFDWCLRNCGPVIWWFETLGDSHASVRAGSE